MALREAPFFLDFEVIHLDNEKLDFNEEIETEPAFDLTLEKLER